MSVLTLITINFISVALGTFLANFSLLWVIGNRAKAAEQEQMKQFIVLQKAAMERVKEDMKKKQEYIKMES